MHILFSDDIRQYISRNYQGCRYSDLTNKVNSAFNTNFTVIQITNFCCKNGFKNGRPRGGENTKFEKGHIPWNKGKKIEPTLNQKKTQFTKGNIPNNAKPIGTEIIGKDGYILVRVECRGISKSGKYRTFIPKQQLIWEQKYGKIPEGNRVIFLDGDKTNFSINNLMLVSNAEHLEMTRYNLRSADSEITKAGALIAKIDCKMKEKVKNAKTK